MDFQNDLVELEEAVKLDTPNQDDDNNLELKPDKQEEIEQVALISPQAAIPLAWSRVEDSILKAVMRLAISPDLPSNNSALKNIQLLRKNASLKAETFHTLNKMRMMRNEAVHGKYDTSNISTGEAMEYSKLAAKMV